MATQEHSESTATDLLGRNNSVEAPADRISRLAAHLDAFLSTLIGEGFDSFDNWNSDIQHELLSLASSLATDLHKTISLTTSAGGVHHG